MPCSLGISIGDTSKGLARATVLRTNFLASACQAETYSTPDIFRACQRLLDRIVLDWRAWATWRPNLDRIRLVEVVEDEQRPTLQALLALEGSDFVGSSGRLSEGVTISEMSSEAGRTTLRWGNMRITSVPGSINSGKVMLDRFSNLLF